MLLDCLSGIWELSHRCAVIMNRKTFNALHWRLSARMFWFFLFFPLQYFHLRSGKKAITFIFLAIFFLNLSSFYYYYFSSVGFSPFSVQWLRSTSPFSFCSFFLFQPFLFSSYSNSGLQYILGASIFQWIATLSYYWPASHTQGRSATDLILQIFI